MIPRLGFSCVIMFLSKLAPTRSIYQLTVRSMPENNHPAFKDMISKFGCKRNSFMHCKHLYFVFVKVFNVDPEADLFIHAPTFSFNEVKLILEGGLLIQSTSYNYSHPSTAFCHNGCVQFWTECELIIDCYNKYNLVDYFYFLQCFVL